MVEVMIERIEDSNLGRVLFSVFFLFTIQFHLSRFDFGLFKFTLIS